MKPTQNVTEFILLGLCHNEMLQPVCFVFFVLLYIATVLGNLLIIVTVKNSQYLKSPMYFFLSYLSFVDMCLSSVTAPKLIADFFVERRTISFDGCIAQLFVVHFFGCTEIFLLTVMAYDRYIAICKPLHYTTIMTGCVCGSLVVSSWVGGFVHSIVQTLLTIQLPFCGPNEIDHYFCDVHPLLKLACTDTYRVGVMVIANTGMISLTCFVVLVVSYVIILVSLRTRSSEGRRKALSTCASHIAVVIIFFGPCIFMYLRPSTTFSEDKMVTVFYTIITPMLNPLIYTLRNEEVKNAIRKLGSRRATLGSHVFGSFLNAECFLLAAMAYDRCVAICKPLLYNITMPRQLCVSLVAGAYTIGLVDSLVHTHFTFWLSFCSSNVIHHFFCDIPALLALSCSDIWLNDLLLFITMSMVEISTTLLILVSYLYILLTIIQTRLAEGKQKAFSTCASHFLCITIFHGTLLFMYTWLSSSYSLDTDKMASVFYMVVIPMLNPLIYSLRNKGVKNALGRVMLRNYFSSSLH
uniref:G-protein coupled receptors family 1 profile domain-containing protein n=1 Tax=Gopherus agassizii TaxID=38772 RepID=A0A452J2L4_9SAUR